MFYHMPYFLEETKGYFCIAEKSIRINDQLTFKPWRAVYGTLENYEYVDFPHFPQSPVEVHCSPIKINNVLSITYGSRVYKKTENLDWQKIDQNVWQGYYDGYDLNYVHYDYCIIKGKKIQLPFDYTLRIAPYKEKYILTGAKDKRKFSIILNEDETYTEIKLNNNDVYKCCILGDKIYYTSKINDNDFENYTIKIDNYIV